jgi:hypothetical protein
MSIKIEDSVSKVTFTAPKPVVKTTPEKIQTQLQEPINTERKQTLAFQGDLAKFRLNKFMPTDAPTVPPKPPVDYFEIDKQADELIKKHTDNGFFGSSLKTGDLGKDLAEIAKTDPTKARALTDNILDKIKDSDRDEVAQSLVDSMKPEELRELAKTEDGRKMLEQLKGHLLSGSVHDDEEKTARRIDTAIKGAELENSDAFKKLSPETQNEIKAQLGKDDSNSKAVDNMLEMVKSGGFNGATKDTQISMLKALANHSEDTNFREALVNLSSDGKFNGLDETNRAKVINNLDRFANTESYKGKEGSWFFNAGAHSVSDSDKKLLLDEIGKVAVYSAQNPGNAIIGNTLEHIVNGDVHLNLYEKKPEVRNGITYYEYGNAGDATTVNLNKLTIGTNFDQFVDTLAHEANHVLNARANGGDLSAGDKPERFLDEYRAFIAGLEGDGKNLSGSDFKSILDNLCHSKDAAYPNLRKLYDNNETFRKVVDQAYADADKGQLINADEMEKRLVAAGLDSDYLKNTSNTDNH